MSFLSGIKQFLTGRSAPAYQEAKEKTSQDLRTGLREVAHSTRDYFKADGEYNKAYLEANRANADLYNDFEKYQRMQRRVDRLSRRLARANEKLNAQTKKVVKDIVAVSRAEDARDAAEVIDHEAGEKAREAIGGTVKTVASDIKTVWTTGKQHASG